MLRDRLSTPASSRDDASKPHGSGSSSTSTGVTPSMSLVSVQQHATDTKLGASVTSLSQAFHRDVSGIRPSWRVSSKSGRGWGMRETQSSPSVPHRTQQSYENTNNSSLFVSQEPEPSSVQSPQTPHTPTRPKRHDRAFIRRVARHGYYEDRFGKYPDVDEDAEGGGTWCSDSEDDSPREEGYQQPARPRRLTTARSTNSVTAAIPDHTKDAKDQTDAGDGEEQDTAAAEFAQSKKIYDQKVAEGKATQEDFVWFSGLEADEKKRLKALEAKDRKKEGKGPAVTVSRSRGMFRHRPSVRFRDSSIDSGDGESQQMISVPSTPTPSARKSGMFTKVPITPKSSSIGARDTSASPNFATASGISRRRVRIQTHEPTTPSSLPRDVSSSDKGLSFGVTYRIDKDTKEVMIPATYVTNMALLHHRTGSLVLSKVETRAKTRQQSVDEEVSMGIVYSIHPMTEEVMIPPTYARNSILLHQRSGALVLSLGSQPSPLKRRKLRGDGSPTKSTRGTASHGRGGSSSSKGGGAGKKRGRPLGSKKKPKDTPKIPVGSSASDPVEIADDASDTDDSE